MTIEDRPNFKTGVVELVKTVGLIAQCAFDPRGDPLYVNFQRKWNASSDKPETFAGKLRKVSNIIRSK